MRRPSPQKLMRAIFLISLSLVARPAAAIGDVILVVGHGGSEPYTEQFATWAEQFKKALEPHAAAYVQIGSPRPDGNGSISDRDRLLQTLKQQTGRDEPLILIFVGHGTASGDGAKFNLVGPDIAADELAGAVEPLNRPVIIFNCSSSSGPFVDALSGSERTIVTATRNANEYNFSRFAGALARVLDRGAADLDHDTEVSVLEAFLAASAAVQSFYEQEGRLASEHALLDDDGDRRGTPADFYRAGRLVKKAKDDATPDGQRAAKQILIPSPDPLPFTAEQLAERDRIETAIERVRAEKSQLPEDEYYRQLRGLFRELAALYAAAEAAKSSANAEAD